MYWFGLAISLVLLLLEYKLTNLSNPSAAIDYFALITLSLFCSLLLITSPMTVPYHTFLRKYSTFNYCIHFNLAWIIVQHTSKSWVGINSLLLFVVVEVIVLLLLCIILKLEKLKAFSWLKYLH